MYLIIDEFGEVDQAETLSSFVKRGLKCGTFSVFQFANGKFYELDKNTALKEIQVYKDPAEEGPQD